MNDQENKSGQSVPYDGDFDWGAESEAIRQRFTDYSPKKVRRYDAYTPPVRSEPTDSIFSSSDGYAAGQTARYTSEPERRGAAPAGKRPGNGTHKAGASAKGNRTGSGSAGQPKRSQKAASAVGRTGQSRPKNGSTAKRRPNDPRSCSTAAGQKRPSGTRGSSRPMSQREKRAEQMRQRRIQKSGESLDKARKSGQSDDEFKKNRAKETRRRRTLRLAVSVTAVCLFALIFAVVLSVTRGAPIETIRIVGESIYSESEILEAAEIAIGDNMIMISPKKLNRKVSELLPYISQLTVEKHRFAGDLVLKVKETTDKIYAQLGTKYVCIDANDKVVSDLKKRVKGDRYKIEGLLQQDFTVGKNFVPDEENGNDVKYATAKKVIKAIEKSAVKKCSLINVASPDRIYIVYDSKVYVYLSPDSDFEYKLSFLANTLKTPQAQAVIAASEQCYIDLQLDNQAVFKPGTLT